MNIYDDPQFFEKYSQMTRSKEGLAGANEWRVFKKLLPNFKNKTVLDLGCGYGWHCNYAVEQGAKRVIGIDQSEKMLKVASEKFPSSKIEFVKEDIEKVDFPENTFDVVMSSLVFHYVENYEALIHKINQMIKANGKIVFTVEHPTFTAYGSQDWYYDDQGKILHFPVDHYFIEENGMRSS